MKLRESMIYKIIKTFNLWNCSCDLNIVENKPQYVHIVKKYSSVITGLNICSLEQLKSTASVADPLRLAGSGFVKILQIRIYITYSIKYKFLKAIFCHLQQFCS